MNSGHHLAFAVKRYLSDTGIFIFQLVFIETNLFCVIYKRAFGRLADGVSGGVKLRVGAERHRGGKKRLVLGIVVDDGHFVLCESSRLVAAYYLRAAESFNRGKLADYCVSL